MVANQKNIPYLYEINRATVFQINPFSAKLDLGKKRKETKTGGGDICTPNSGDFSVYSGDISRSVLGFYLRQRDSYSYTGHTLTLQLPGNACNRVHIPKLNTFKQPQHFPNRKETINFWPHQLQDGILPSLRGERT